MKQLLNYRAALDITDSSFTAQNLISNLDLSILWCSTSAGNEYDYSLIAVVKET